MYVADYEHILGSFVGLNGVDVFVDRHVEKMSHLRKIQLAEVDEHVFERISLKDLVHALTLNSGTWLEWVFQIL